MSVTWSLNLTPADGSTAIYNIKTAMKSAGWTVPRSGTGTGGTTSTSDLITSGAASVGGFGNTGAWFVIAQPSGGRQFMFQNTGTSTDCWIRLSQSAGFTGGTATTAATATDVKNILGINSSGTGTAATLFGTDNTYRQNIMADGSSPYGVYSVCWPTGGGVVNSLFMIDPITSSPSDADPYVYMASSIISFTQIFPVSSGAYSANNLFMRTDFTANNGEGQACGYIGSVTTGHYVPISAALYFAGFNVGAQLAVPGNLATNPNTTKDDEFPVIYCRHTNTVGSGATNTAPVGYKGTSTLLKWMATNRATGSLLTVVSTGDRLILDGSATLPWQSGTSVTL